ncbi:hypothetical protein P692DRAFT_20721030, partial [Suillus brevipes Sb2]
SWTSIRYFYAQNSRPYSPSANTAVTCHYDITDTTTLYAGAILNDLNEVLCRTEKQKCMAAVITRESSALIFVCKHP